MKRFNTLICCLAIATSSICSFGQDYKAFLEQGQKLYNERQYDAAIKVLNAGLVGSDENAAAELNSWIKKCTDAKVSLAARAKADRERFEISSNAISFFSEGGTYEIIIDAAAEWTIMEFPEWCTIKQDDKKLTITCKKNNDLVIRTGEVRITMAYLDGKIHKEKSQIISISQDAREPEIRKVHFVTSPGNANVRFINDKIEGNSSETFTLGEGVHKVIISKPMYIPKEISITVSPEEKDDLANIRVYLEPQYSRIKLKIDAADGTMISENDMPSFRIGEQYVDLSPYFTGRGSLSFDSDDEIAYGKLYDGNIIPIAPGTYGISIKAENFYPIDDTITIGDNEEKTIHLMLEPHKGLLHIFNESGADGAKIFVDKKEVGVVPTSVSLPKGSHVIEFSKPGYISTKKSYLIEIGDNDTAILNLEMKPYTLVTITSEPSKAEVHLDDDDVVIYSPVVNEKIAQGIHKFKITKQGYMTKFGELNIVGDSLSLHYNLQEAFPMIICTEKNIDYFIEVQDKDGNILTEPRASISNPVYLPYGKYLLKLTNIYSTYNQQGYKIANDLVYKGTVDFHGQDRIKKLTYSENKFSILGGTWYSNGAHFSISDSGDYSSFINADFLKFALFNGFTTSFVKLNTYKSIHAADSKYLFSGTCVFLNGEFRLGGALHDNIDICAMGSYRFTPNLEQLEIVNFDYLSGWDWFAGVEISSRIPVFNGSIRLGWQGLSGEFNKAGSSNNKHVSCPIKSSAMVMALSFTLGGRDSKGVDYIRVF